jgi:hypothetical protein
VARGGCNHLATVEITATAGCDFSQRLVRQE